MKELDLLKKDWQKSEASFEQLSEKDIYAMIHKKIIFSSEVDFNCEHFRICDFEWDRIVIK